MNRTNTGRSIVSSAILLTFMLFISNSIISQCSLWQIPSASYCINDPIVPLVGSPSPGIFLGPGVTGSNFNPLTAGPGSHQLRYKANTCTDTAVITMTVQALPVVTLLIPNSEKFVCEFDGPYTISGNNPNPGWPTSWFTGPGVDSLLGTFDPDPSLVGWNKVTFYFDNGVCRDSVMDSILVQDNPTANISAFPVLCVTDPVLSLIHGNGLPAGGSFTYSGVAVTGSMSSGYFFDPALSGAGTFVITYCYTAVNNCETCVSQNIEVYDVPVVNFAIPPPLCENGGPLNLANLGIGIPGGGYFSGPGIQDDSVSINPSQMGGAGSYTITYTYVDTNGCSASGSQNVTVNPKPVITITSLGPNPTPNPPTDNSNITIKICLGDTAFTSITSSPAFSPPWPSVNPNTPTFWTNQGGNYVFHPPIDVLFEIVVQSTDGCYDTGSVNIDVIPPATAELTGPNSICIGDTATISVVGATNYNWLNPSGVSGPSISVTPKATTVFVVQALSDLDGNLNLCSSDTGTHYLRVDPLPLVTTARDTTIFFGDQTVLRAYGAQAFVWSEIYEGELDCYQCLSPTAKPAYQPGQLPYRVYYVLGTDSNGCKEIDSIIVNLSPKIIIYVPTAFSPNGDGVNDLLFVETKGVRSIELEVYDRFGQTVFETKDLFEGWNGTLNGNGELLSKDVYLYRLKATAFEEKVPLIEQAGQINLIR